MADALCSEEGIDGIDAVDGRIPNLRPFFLQKPAAHLINGLFLSGSDHANGFNGSHLGRYLVVIPRVGGALRIVETSHLLSKHGIFLQTLDILVGQFGLATLVEHHGRECLLVDGLPFGLLLQQVHQIVVSVTDVLGLLLFVYGTDVQPA